MEQEKQEGKWYLLEGRKLVYSKGTYTLNVWEVDKQWMWDIIEDGKQVDHVAYHPYFPSGELDARIKAEKALTKIIEKYEQVHQGRETDNRQTEQGGPIDQAVEAESENTGVSN